MSNKSTEQNEPEANEPLSAPALPLELSRKLKKLTSVVAPPQTSASAKGESVAVKVKHAGVEAKPVSAPAKQADDAVETSNPLLGGEDEASSNDKIPEANSEPETSAPEPLPTEDTAEEDEFADAKTDAAVDDIVRDEGDQILAAEDAKNGNGQPVEPPKKKHHFFKKWLGTSLGRWLTFIVIVAVAAGIFAVPTARYTVLNRFGVRASLSATVTDGGTLLPLEGVTISMDGQTATTNSNGVATLHHLRLGSQTLTVSRVAYATQTQNIVVGWGENPLGTPVTLKPTGVKYIVRAVDYFSGAAITGASATESDNSEVSADKNGLITLSLDTNGNTSATVAVGAKGYLNTSATLKPNTTNVVMLTPDQQNVYIAKESGKYNVYTSNADGSNQQLLLAGTGLETNQMSLAASPDNSEAALVSLRDNTVDAHGNAEQALTLVNVGTAAATVIDHADQIRLLDWNGTVLVYEAVTQASGGNAAQYAILSYDYKTATRQELASSSDFDVVLAADGSVFYSPNSSNDKTTVGLYKVNDNGGGQQTLLSQEVLGLYRTNYNTLLAQTADAWYSYSLDSSAAPQQIATPASHTNVSFVLSPDGNNAAAIVNVNGTATLQITNVASGKTTNLTTPALTYPVHWLNDNTVVFRAGGTAPADYGVGISGGTAKKIVSVFGANGFVAGE
ncbi:MAG TPA: carboxypeptidase regulatory-like domain-containing protein [Candidatus Saccharimonadales bacterium]